MKGEGGRGGGRGEGEWVVRGVYVHDIGRGLESVFSTECIL